MISDPLQNSMRIAGAGLRAQAVRMQVVSENIANSQTTASASGEDPFRRKTIVFGEELSRVDGGRYVGVKSIGRDASPFRIVRDPGHPAADEKGDVKMPNVDPILELADLREANHDYQAGLQVLKQVRDLFSMTVDLLRA